MYEKSNYSRCSEKALLNSSKGYCIFHEDLENKDIADCMNKFYDKIRKCETDFERYISAIWMKIKKIKNFLYMEFIKRLVGKTKMKKY